MVIERELPLIRDNPDGTRRQLEFYTSTEENEDAAYFIKRHNLQPPEGWTRTGNTLSCEMCGNPYINHRIAWPWFWLNRLCDGRYVKL